MTQATRRRSSVEHELGDAAGTLREIARSDRTRGSLYREAVEILTDYFKAPFGLVGADTASGRFEHMAVRSKGADRCWKSLCDELLLDSQYRNLAVAKLVDAAELKRRFAVLAVPLVEESNPSGSIAIVVEASDKTAASAKLAELKALAGLLGALAASPQPVQRTAGAPAETDHSGASKAGNYKSFQEYAFALANGLKTKLDCEQVSLGLVHRSRVRVLCISGFDDLYPRSPGGRLICQAMEECHDAGHPVWHQPNGSWDEDSGTAHFIHRRWHEESGNVPVASIPFRYENRTVAVLSIRHRRGKGFVPADIEKIEKIVAPLIPGLLLLKRAGRSLIRHAIDSVGDTGRSLFSTRAIGRKLVFFSLAAAIAWLAFGTMNFVVTVPCEVVPRKVRQIAAPIEGVLSSSHVEPGSKVSEGDILLQFDTRDLELELNRLLAQRDIGELDLAKALAADDHTAASQAAANIKMTRARLKLIQLKIQRSTVKAPQAGTILSGETDTREGEMISVGTPMLEFSSENEWCVQLQVPQYAVRFLRSGQTGRFATVSAPDLYSECTLTRPPISSSVIEGTQTFIAEADLVDRPDWMRTGMTGIAKIEAGIRPAWWVLLHRSLDTIRFWLWQL